MTLRVAVIGLGPIGNRHAKLYAQDELAELVGVCDIIKEKANRAAQLLGAPAFYDAEAMLRELAPDVVSIATGGFENSSDHYLPTMQALAAGCHVLGEKPISNRIDQAEEMVAKAQELGLCYGINLNHRFTPAARLAKSWVEQGRLGHLLFINMAMWIMNRAETSPFYHIKSLHPAHGRCHALFLRRYRSGALLRDQGARATNLVDSPIQFPLPQWRGRRLDRQL